MFAAAPFRRDRHAAGFTLAELLVVISVLGMLSSVVVVSVGGAGDRGQAAACATDVKVLQTAEDANRAEFGGYGTEDDLVAHALLSAPSALHDITVGSGDYTVTGTGPCTDGGHGSSATTIPSATTTTVPPTTTTLGHSVTTGSHAGVTVQLLDSSGNGVAGAAVSYYQSWWSAMGTTATDGTINANLGAGSYTFHVDYQGETDSYGPVSVTSGSVVTFRAALVSVRLTGGGANLPAAPVSTFGNDGYWVGRGSTDGTGVATFLALLGSYYVSADFRGQTSQQSSVVVNGDRNVDFPLSTVTVRLTQGPASLGASSVGHYGSDGYWVGDGTTDATGALTTVLLPAASYYFHDDFQGETQQQTVAVAAPATTIDFALTAVTIRLTGASGSLTSAALGHYGNDGYWVGDGTTDTNGLHTVYVLPGTNYYFHADYRGQTSQQSGVNVTGASMTVDFPLTTTLLRLTGGSGSLPAATVGHYGNDGYWVGDGSTDASGVVSVTLLASTTYYFHADFRGMTQQVSNVSISGPTTTVDFALSTVTVSVTHGGSAAANVSISVYANDGYWVGLGNTDSSGSLTSLLLAGTYTMNASLYPDALQQQIVMPNATPTFAF